MTVDARPIGPRPGLRDPSAGPAAVLAAVAGCLAIAARTPSWTAVGVTVVVGATGAIAPVARDRRASAVVWCAVVALGVGAFASIRLVALAPVSPPSAIAIGAGVAAAISEELFFRRFLYGMLARRGAAVAIGMPAVAFAVVHIPAYGAASLPINLAAGVLLGWQRWATGSWTAPAASHLAANVLSLI